MRAPNITHGEWDCIRLGFGNDRSLDKFAIRQNPFSLVSDPKTRQTLDIATVEAEDGEANARAISALPAVLSALDDAAAYLAALDEMRPDSDHGSEGKRIREVIKAALLAAGYTEGGES